MSRASTNAEVAQSPGGFRLEGRVSLSLLLAVLFVSCQLMAQDSSPIPRSHFELTPLVSYRSSMHFTTQTAVDQNGPQVALDSGIGYGFGFGFHVRPADVIEFRWMRQNSTTRVEDSSLGVPSVKTTVDQFHCDLSHEYIPKGRSFRFAPFIMASVGATNMNSELGLGSSHLSVGIGGGVKFFVSQHLGLRIHADWAPVFVGSRELALCGSACGLRLNGALGSQAEIALGPVLRF